MNPQFGKFGGKAGILLAAIGLIAIGVGWNGAAGQLTLLGQIPYILSGGLIGLSLVVLGAAMLVVQGAREDRARLEAKLDLMTDALLVSGTGTTSAPAPQDVSGLVIAGTASYHVPGCRLVDGREETSYLTPAEARANDLKPCRVCAPEDVTNVVVR
ncbi:MAG: hypothetical protein JWN77_11 [Frankiales bacterium]|jgi:hypothetical protein|nr:hypothetical protein [Frankiales bacterium]